MSSIIIEIVTTKGEAHTVHIDPEELSIGFMEDMEQARESGRWADLITVAATMFGLTRDVTRDIRLKDWKRILEALQGAGQAVADGPNA